MQRLEKLNTYLLNSKSKRSILDSYITHNELTVVVEPSSLPTFLEFLKTNRRCLFRALMDICGADYPHKPIRFEVVYHLLSMELNLRIRVKVLVNEDTAVPSVTGVFSAAGWFEREIWDLYGIRFSGNADLRRILTDYGFEGHPLRKDFPLSGRVEVRYDLEKKSVVYEPVLLTQEFRDFDFLSPWGGPNYNLPGDEKTTKE